LRSQPCARPDGPTSSYANQRRYPVHPARCRRRIPARPAYMLSSLLLHPAKTSARMMLHVTRECFVVLRVWADGRRSDQAAVLQHRRCDDDIERRAPVDLAQRHDATRGAGRSDASNTRGIICVYSGDSGARDAEGSKRAATHSRRLPLRRAARESRAADGTVHQRLSHAHLPRHARQPTCTSCRALSWLAFERVVHAASRSNEVGVCLSVVLDTSSDCPECGTCSRPACVCMAVIHTAASLVASHHRVAVIIMRRESRPHAEHARLPLSHQLLPRELEMTAGFEMRGSTSKHTPRASTRSCGTSQWTCHHSQ
jgi:hypothetical protein